MSLFFSAKPTSLKLRNPVSNFQFTNIQPQTFGPSSRIGIEDKPVIVNLHTLHQRPKWKMTPNLARVGQLILLRNSNLPSCRWELGRIIKCHPGDDDLVQVISVKTSSGEYKRPIAKLSSLPVTIDKMLRHNRSAFRS